MPDLRSKEIRKTEIKDLVVVTVELAPYVARKRGHTHEVMLLNDIEGWGLNIVGGMVREFQSEEEAFVLHDEWVEFAKEKRL